ncbi:MAG: multicopper oxidase family protein [Rhodothermales bacterium]|nr:multicopper oxidase family protein [Rhodothermales bacterium]MBO6778572.1 multicopper oxidase family protein [Rhodothermales bacterium]
MPRLIGCLLAALLVLPATGQDHHMHHGHDLGAMQGDSLVWRMVPMDMSMPMLPGLETAVPVVGPWLAGTGMDLMTIPEGRPREVVEMNDGDTLHLEASLIRREIGGQTVVMYGYNGQYPGPLIRAERGSEVTVHFTNNIEMPTTVHWHGLRLDNAFDGIPGMTQPPVMRGESFTYQLKFPDTGIYWYHPHMREDIQQDLGLYGNMLVDPDVEAYYNPVTREEVLILDDLLMDDAGILPYGDESPTHALMGRFGNVMLTNGRTDYSLDVPRGGVVRYYITNVANSRTFNVVFDGARAKIVASDVSKFEHEEFVPSVVIAPAERYVVEVHYPESGEFAIRNSVQAINHFRGVFYPEEHHLATVQVGDAAADPGAAAAFAELRTNDDVTGDIDAYRDQFDRQPDHTLELTVRVDGLPLPIVRSMEIDTLYVPPIEWNDAMPMMNWLSSAEQVEWVIRDLDTGRENMDINWDFGVGDVVKIRVFNNPKSFHPMNHPFHVHGQRFLVLDMDGVRNPNLVWKDTAIVPVGSTMDLLVDMSNPGDWMAHCHIAEHLHAGMMLGFRVVEGDRSQ